MLLDDVMSELDQTRRRALVDQLRRSGGQSVITTTDVEYVPGSDEPDVAHVSVLEGRVHEEVMAE
jgi:DNA replication and repair protein RecF